MDPRQASQESLPRDDSSTSDNDRDELGNGSSGGDWGRDSQSMRRHDSRAFMEDRDQQELHRIATAVSLARRDSVATVPGGMEAFRRGDPTLDPADKSFDIVKWAKNFVKSVEDEGISFKRTGVMYKDLGVSGTGEALQLQKTVSDVIQAPLRMGEHFSFGKKQAKHILNSFDGLLKSGELLVVLGRPGSGCSTLLKTMTGQLHGLAVEKDSIINYEGISQQQMKKEFKGEMNYNEEVDKHFPHLTVGQTLEFAAAVRTPSRRVGGISRATHIKYAVKLVMALCGLTHTYNTKVGNEYIRGVSGGERKRVSIAEMMIAGSPLSAWDNSTRGLDSATALKFVKTLRLAADFAGMASAVAIYQASQAIYNLFDKAVVLYEGRQIFFGPASDAKAYFEKMGWHCPQRQTTGDFLTSVTNPSERKAREGMEDKVPRTPEEFEKYWRQSLEFQALREEIDEHERQYPIDPRGQTVEQMREHKNRAQAKHVRPKSPYTVSIAMQVKLTTQRAYRRIWNDISATATETGVFVVLALILGSLFYGTSDGTASFYARGSILFQALLLNALSAIAEINNQYAQRPVVEKHAAYAFYHPFAEAVAGVVADIPIKFFTLTVFNIIVYFLSGLRREPSQFFIYFLFLYVSTFTMSAIFKTLAAVTKTVSQAMMLAGVIVLALVIYTGFVVPVPLMRPWLGWIRFINPIFYAFESLVANEFHGREFPCSQVIPPYSPAIGNSWICSVVGAVAGEPTVSGDAFIQENYQYYYSHVWRNFGILLAFLFFFMFCYFAAVELNSATASSAEFLVFQRGHVPAYLQKNSGEKPPVTEALAKSGSPDKQGQNEKLDAIERQKDVFTWIDVVYDVPIKGEDRRLLDHVSGWVKPGTLTALMGVSGAGKTTLLDALAQRTTMGVITGDMLVNGKPLDASFQRNIGYVQQQDLHLETATVRESLRFSAMLRQPKTVSREEKHRYVEEVIDMLGMQDFADAVVGMPGEGLNVEQRKLLTIGVELAAKPKLLLFLDEPTSGLDSQSSWAICAFLRKLADAGQAILCTVHQPSAVLFQEFDRLLFLAAGGKTVYFGDIGESSSTLLNYFESNGARKCGDEENPAEYMLEIVNAGTNPSGQSWHSVWKAGPEYQAVMREIERIHEERINETVDDRPDVHSDSEFAMPLAAQMAAVTNRVFQQYWRMPSYIFAKFILGAATGLFIGFSFFNADGTLAGMQTVLFSVFMIITVFSTLVQQIQPQFITQRSLYEVRERPSKAYSWQAFMLANVFVEIPYQIFTGILVFACFYYPVVGVQTSAQQGLILLFTIQLMLYASSFAQMTIAALPDAQTAASIVTALVLISLAFCGVLQAPSALPGFWIFMYRVSPFTYWVSGIISTELHGRAVECSASETSIFSPPQGQSCGEYLAPFLSRAPGTLQNPNDTESCRYCAVSVADVYLAGSGIYYSDRWRNFGIMFAYIIFNIFVAVVSYWALRVKKWHTKAPRVKVPKVKKTKGADKA